MTVIVKKPSKFWQGVLRLVFGIKKENCNDQLINRVSSDARFIAYKLNTSLIKSNMIYFDFKKIRFSFSFGFFFVLAFLCTDSSILAAYSLVFCVIHELAHLFAMREFGAEVTEVSFYGGGIKISSHGLSELGKAQQLAVYSAGCITNISMALIYLVINSAELALINLCLAAMNLLPISYLDGGKILSILFPQKVKMLKSLSFITAVLVVVLFVFGVVLFVDFKLSSLTITIFVFVLSHILD